MSERIVIADSGPLIGFSRVDHLDWLPALFTRVQVPTAVWREVTQGAAEGRSGAAEVRAATWIDVVSVDSSMVAGYALLVDQGEAEAIVLAQAAPSLLLIDDDRGRRLALRQGIQIKGTLGILVLAKRRGLVDRVRPLLDAPRQRGIYASQRLIEATLREAGE